MAGDHRAVFDEARLDIMLIDDQALAFAVGDRLDLGGGLVIGRSTATATRSRHRSISWRFSKKPLLFGGPGRALLHGLKGSQSTSLR
jgi:hypothetical protein